MERILKIIEKFFIEAKESGEYFGGLSPSNWACIDGDYDLEKLAAAIEKEYVRREDAPKYCELDSFAPYPTIKLKGGRKP